MQFRIVLSCAIILLLWFVIGIGFSLNFENFSSDNLKTVLKQEDKFPSFTYRDVKLTAEKFNENYESIVFVGDVLLARNVEFLMRAHGSDYPYQGIDFKNLSLSPAVVGNFEASIPKEHVPTPIKQINFSVDSSHIGALYSNGFSHLSLANNHSYDFDTEGLRNTRDTLANRLSVFGDPNKINEYSVTTLIINQKEIGLLGINALVKVDTVALKNALTSLSNETDFQIVYVHWGEEYALHHNNSQRALAEKLVSYGADLVIGHHPHVVQGVDMIEGVPVFYSLGNYIFDQYFSKDVQEGLIVVLNISDEVTISLLPVTSRHTLSQPTLMEQNEHADFLYKLARRSNPELYEEVASGIVTLNHTVATSEGIAIIHATNKYVE